jgi:hypothetical protein
MVTDRYGQALDRTNVYYDTTRTVVVKIVDRYAWWHSTSALLGSVLPTDASATTWKAMQLAGSAKLTSHLDSHHS